VLELLADEDFEDLLSVAGVLVEVLAEVSDELLLALFSSWLVLDEFCPEGERWSVA